MRLSRLLCLQGLGLRAYSLGALRDLSESRDKVSRGPKSLMGALHSSLPTPSPESLGFRAYKGSGFIRVLGSVM